MFIDLSCTAFVSNRVANNTAFIFVCDCFSYSVVNHVSAQDEEYDYSAGLMMCIHVECTIYFFGWLLGLWGMHDYSSRHSCGLLAYTQGAKMIFF